MVELWQQRDYERQVLLEDIMRDANQNLDDQGMIEVAADFLYYIRISVMRNCNLKFSSRKESIDYMAMIEEFARTPEENNVMVDRLKDKLESAGAVSFHNALLQQQITEPERLYDLALLAQED